MNADLTVRVWEESCRLSVSDGPVLLAGYRYSPLEPHPFLYPLVAPNSALPGLAKSVTQDGPADHMHHRSLWWGHGDVDGVDFWLEEPHCGRIVHTGFGTVETAPGTARFVATSSWRRPDGSEVLSDRRDVTVRTAAGDGLEVDLDVTLLPAGDGSVELGETVEGGLPALRLADTIDLFDGGHLLTSEGVSDHDVSGTDARWLAAWGTLDASPPARNAVCGVAVLDHPGNPGHPSRWFCRPFGWLTPAGTQFGARSVTRDGLRLRHRILVFAGEADADVLEHAWQEYACRSEAGE